jgi:hypothetical protein
VRIDEFAAAAPPVQNDTAFRPDPTRSGSRVAAKDTTEMSSATVAEQDLCGLDEPIGDDTAARSCRSDAAAVVAVNAYLAV